MAWNVQCIEMSFIHSPVLKYMTIDFKIKWKFFGHFRVNIYKDLEKSIFKKIELVFVPIKKQSAKSWNVFIIFFLVSKNWQKIQTAPMLTVISYFLFVRSFVFAQRLFLFCFVLRWMLFNYFGAQFCRQLIDFFLD